MTSTGTRDTRGTRGTKGIMTTKSSRDTRGTRRVSRAIGRGVGDHTGTGHMVDAVVVDSLWPAD